ncbi:mitochondrial ATPase inhibitor, IATP-domain-containing protein [Xylaria intraflava]|nr:mitochondrial ATPase inhibitor, IATP-domain-containing protein [Xylaria intraflava]
MFRQTLTKIPSRALAAPVSRRAFTTTLPTMAEGDTGAPPSTGSLDAFQRRERASENFAIREREKEKLLELRKKLAVQQEHIKKLTDHIDELTKEQGGENN